MIFIILTENRESLLIFPEPVSSSEKILRTLLRKAALMEYIWDAKEIVKMKLTIRSMAKKGFTNDIP